MSRKSYIIIINQIDSIIIIIMRFCILSLWKERTFYQQYESFVNVDKKCHLFGILSELHQEA